MANKTEVLAQLKELLDKTSPEDLHCCLFTFVTKVPNQTDDQKLEVSMGAIGTPHEAIRMITELSENVLGAKVIPLNPDGSEQPFIQTTRH